MRVSEFSSNDIFTKIEILTKFRLFKESWACL